jgi:hypothetical protein
VVRVSETEPRVVIEDVRTRERVVAVGVEGVTPAIARLLDEQRPTGGPPAAATPRRPTGERPA